MQAYKLTQHCSSFEEEILYVQGVYDLCHAYDILFIADEIRMGVCRTGRFLSSDYLGGDRKPDIVVLGKSITGGVYPASFVLGAESVMNVVGTREIVQTFAFSPMAIAATTAILEIVDEERLAENAIRLSEAFLEVSRKWRWEALPFVDYVTARGAEFGIWFRKGCGEACRIVSLRCMHDGLLTFPKDEHLRMSAPLVIAEHVFTRALDILNNALFFYAANHTEGTPLKCML